MASLPPYASVFQGSFPRLPLLRLDDEDRLSVFHAKYWGVNIDQDESKWIGAHGQLMDVDGSEVVRGCFVLGLDNDYFMASKLWVRKDYLRMYDRCDSHYEDVRNRRLHLRPSVVITGQPGVGKTYWILYAVRRRLGEAKPFLWYFAARWYLFVQDGVFEYPGLLNSTLFARYIWAFVDGDESPSGVPPGLTAVESKLFTIFTSFPSEDRWKPVTKNTYPITLIMNPWTWEEMTKAVDIHMLTEVQRTRAEEVFLEYGPTPRLCIDFLEYPFQLDDYRDELRRAISNLTLDSLLSAVRMSENLNMNLSHSIFLVQRKDVNKLHGYTIEPISLSVKRLLKKQLMKVEQKERLRTYLLLARVQGSRIMTSIVFESLAQLQLQEEVSLNLVPMVEVPAPRKGNAKWESQPSSRADTANPPFLTQFKPMNTVEYDKSELSRFNPGVFYVPMSNQVAFDSFMLVDQVLYIFQFSISASHEITEDIMKFLSQPTLEEKLQGAEWRFVFVIPPGSTIVCSESNVAKLKGFWDRAGLFTAEIDVHK